MINNAKNIQKTCFGHRQVCAGQWHHRDVIYIPFTESDGAARLGLDGFVLNWILKECALWSKQQPSTDNTPPFGTEGFEWLGLYDDSLLDTRSPRNCDYVFWSPVGNSIACHFLVGDQPAWCPAGGFSALLVLVHLNIWNSKH